MDHSGFETTTYTGHQQHYQSFCHPSIGDVIDTILRDAFGPVSRIDITPKPPRIKDETIITEQGIRININQRGIQVGPL